MDSIPLDMDDLFGEHEGDDDEGFNPSRLPDLEDELEPMRDMRQDEDGQGGEGEGDFTDNAELLAKLKSMKGASKNTTKRSMPKLDAERLTGSRGMVVVPKAFERVPLKGKNHEAEDLKVVMHTLQHWGHRLFPKMTFDEVLERVERLGAKKEVQTCLKKIRLDMLEPERDVVDGEDDTVRRAGDDGDVVHRGEDDEEVVRRGSDVDQDMGEVSDDDVQRTTGNHSLNEISDDELEGLLRDQGQPIPSQSVKSTPTEKNSGLSDDVRKRIEENKRKAMERRAARMADPNKSTNDSLNISRDISLEDQNGSSKSSKEVEPQLSTSNNNARCDENPESLPAIPRQSPVKDVDGNKEQGTGPFDFDALATDPEIELEPMETDWGGDEVGDEQDATTDPSKNEPENGGADVQPSDSQSNVHNMDEATENGQIDNNDNHDRESLSLLVPETMDPADVEGETL